MGLFKDCGCGCNGRKQQGKLMTAVITGLIFFAIANPETFRVIRRLLGPRIATPTGCPSTLGLFVHTIVFILIIWAMMNLKQEAPVAPTVNDEAETMPIMMAPAPPMRQADIVPEPGMEDMPFFDSGRELGSMDLNPM